MSNAQGFLLVVDDEELNRDMLGRRLEIEGYEVLTAADGAEALALIKVHDFDAILLDVMMPGQSGYEVLAQIRKTFSSLELPVLMVTAKNQNEDIINAFECGANDYITKPINFPVALARIHCHIASRKLCSQLRESETRYSLSAQGSNDGLWDWDLVTDKVHFSSRWKSMLGYQPADIGDSPDELFIRIHPDDLHHVQQTLAAHRLGETTQFESEHRMLHADQTYRWMLMRGVAFRDRSGRSTRMAGSQTDITRGKAADPLTGLPNRVLFTDHLSSAVEDFQSNPDVLFAVLFIDLDRFKVVNDSLGHHAGDELLVQVANRLEKCVRAAEDAFCLHDRCTIARFGGDEFVVLVRGLKEPANACDVANRILSALSQPLHILGQEVPMSASIGIALGSHNCGSAEDLIRDADTAMYRAKSDGKSRWCMFDHTLRKQAMDRLTLEADLKRGFERGEFCVYYQPIVSLDSSKILGFEALLRWQHATRGLVSPADFIPIAEETGFIMEIGTWVLEQSCQQLFQWQNEYPSSTPLYVSVNVSCKQFTDPLLKNRVADCLQRTGLAPECLKLEITESAIMANREVATRTLTQLQELGVQISLDDFGTGYSSLSYLEQFPINTVKIDRSFITRLGSSNESKEIVRSIVSLAHSLGMDVTAEGIEEENQLTRLSEFACETGQGFLYSQPIPVAQIEELLQSRGQPMKDEEPANASGNGAHRHQFAHS